MKNCRFVLIAALALALPVLSGQAPQQEVPWRSWLVRVEHAHRRDPLPDDARRIEALTEKLEQAESDREKSSIERQLVRARERADARAGFVIYGWSMHADGQGRSVTKTSAMAGFFIPGGRDVEQMLRDMQPGDCIAIDRRGSTDLFTFSGRKYVRAKRGVVVQCDDSLKSQAFSVPPQTPMTDAQRAIDVQLTFSKTTPHNDNTRHTYMLKVEADGSATKGTELTLWLNVRFVGDDGEVYGPIIDEFDVPRSSRSGNFTVTRSMEVITYPGFDLDEKKATVELIAAR
jgi:hypothetical protein